MQTENLERLTMIIHTYEWSQMTLGDKLQLVLDSRAELAALRAENASLKKLITEWREAAGNAIVFPTDAALGLPFTTPSDVEPTRAEIVGTE